MDNENYKLSVLDTLHKAIVTITGNAYVLFKALLLPTILMTLVSIGRKLMLQHAMSLREYHYLAITNFTTLIVTGILAAIFAVTCHRIALLGKDSLPNSLGLYFTKRELKYFGWVFLFSIPMVIGFMAIAMIAPLFMKFMDDPREIILLLNRVWSIAGLVIVSFITAPFILVLPATAVGEKGAFKKARATVKGNIIRLAVVLVILPLITSIIGFTLRHFGPEANNIPYDVIIYLIYSVFVVFETVVLSISYKSLASDHLEKTY